MAVNSKLQEAHVRNKRLAWPIGGLTFTCIISALIVSSLFYRVQKSYRSYLLAEQSRFSLFCLTFLLRSYAMTGNQKYLQLYKDSAAISDAPISRSQLYQCSELRLLALALLYSNNYLAIKQQYNLIHLWFFKLYEWRAAQSVEKDEKLNTLSNDLHSAQLNFYCSFRYE